MYLNVILEENWVFKLFGYVKLGLKCIWECIVIGWFYGMIIIVRGGLKFYRKDKDWS